MLVTAADVLAQSREFTEKEIELWVEHLGPVWKKDDSWMKKALANWYAAMQSAGLAPEGENKMEKFVRGVL